MSKTAIRVDNLGKKYNIGLPVVKYQTLRDKISEGFSRREKIADSYIWALRNVSFEVNEGQALGVIGRNGAGKSTLLKILSRVTEPTEGVVEIRGRVGSLLEVGTGFHPELTGRENIFLNGAMYLRLAFAVAAHLEPEILVVDEVLAVGDAEFQKKCLGKMSDVAQQGRTVLFVSHNMSAVLRLTNETLVIDHGQLLMRGPTQEAVDFYLSQGLTQEGQKIWREDEIAEAAKPFKPVAIRVLDKQGVVADTVRSIEPFTIEIEYELQKPLKGLRVGIYLLTTRGEYIFTSFDTDDVEQYEANTVRPAGRYFSRCEIPANLLNEGRYVIGMNASTYLIKRYFQDDQALLFNVDPAGAPGMQWVETRLGTVRPALKWKIESYESGDMQHGEK